MKIFLCLCFITYINTFNYLLYNKSSDINFDYPDEPIPDVFKADIDLIDSTELRVKKLACLILLRNNLYTNNTAIYRAMKQTKYNKSEVFNKALVLIFTGCTNKLLDEAVIQEVINILYSF